MAPFQLEQKDFEIIRGILVKYKLEGLVFVYGSRSKGSAKKFSDLDLVVKPALERAILLKLQGEFTDSDLTIKVDVASWGEMDESFRKQIEKDLLPLDF